MKIDAFELAILGARSTVKTVDPKSEGLEFGNNLGTRDSETGEILLSRAMAPRRWWEVLWHETIEGVNSEMELNLSHPQISAWTTTIISLLDHNPILRSVENIPKPDIIITDATDISQ